MKFKLPPVTPWAELEEARERLARLTDDLAVATTAHKQVLRERNEAVEADRLALAAALRAGKPKPKAASVERVDAKVDGALRDREGLELALRMEEEALVVLLDSHREEWLAHIDSEASPKARAAALVALDDFAGARRELAELYALRSFVASSSERRLYKANVATRVPALRKQSGEPYTVEEAIACLRESLEERQPVGEESPRKAVG